MTIHRIVLGGCLAAALAFNAASSLAQAPVPAEAGEGIYELRLGNGSRVYGVVVEDDGERIVFESVDGTRLELNRHLARLTPARGRVVGGEFWPEDRNATRLFFAPTGRTLGAGEGYAGVFLILPFVGYGATSDLTLAGGLPPVGDAGGSSPVWLAPKLRVLDTPGMQISTGVFAMYTPGYEGSGYCDSSYCEEPRDGSWDGIAYAMGTFGGEDEAVHAGIGVATMGEGNGVRVPLVLGGEHRMSRRSKLITENWIIPGEGGAAMFGMRRIGDRWTTDLGWMFLFDSGEVPYFPIVSFSYAFGGGR